MMPSSRVRWVVQESLTAPVTVQAFRTACADTGVQYLGIQVIPFSNSLPPIPQDGSKNIFYGSTTLMYLAHRDPVQTSGIFFDEVSFSMKMYLNHYRPYMLNADAELFTVEHLSRNTWPGDQKLFVRPVDDSKSFTGTVMRNSELREWAQAILHTGDPDGSLTRDSELIVSSPKQVKREWRLWIVKKKVVAASQYRENFELKKESGCPDEVRIFAEARSEEYAPHDVFVMDIAESDGRLSIIECGCMNSCGLYAADVAAIVNRVSDYRRKQ